MYSEEEMEQIFGPHFIKLLEEIQRQMERLNKGKYEWFEELFKDIRLPPGTSGHLVWQGTEEADTITILIEERTEWIRKEPCTKSCGACPKCIPSWKADISIPHPRKLTGTYSPADLSDPEPSVIKISENKIHLLCSAILELLQSIEKRLSKAVVAVWYDSSDSGDEHTTDEDSDDEDFDAWINSGIW